MTINYERGLRLNQTTYIHTYSKHIHTYMYNSTYCFSTTYLHIVQLLYINT